MGRPRVFIVTLQATPSEPVEEFYIVAATEKSAAQQAKKLTNQPDAVLLGVSLLKYHANDLVC